MKGGRLHNHRVFKYHLGRPMDVVFNVPHGSQILGAGMQDDHIVLWMLVDPSEPLSDNRRIHAFNTGVPLGDGDFIYIDTVTHSGGIVWHIFEEITKEPA